MRLLTYSKLVSHRPFGHSPADDGSGRGGKRQLEYERCVYGAFVAIAQRRIGKEVAQSHEAVVHGTASELNCITEYPVRET